MWLIKLHLYLINYHILCISFLQKCTPEFIGLLRRAVDQLIVYGWQPIIYDHINPFSKTPETEVKDSSIFLWSLLVPVLFLNIWDHLQYAKKLKIYCKHRTENIHW